MATSNSVFFAVVTAPPLDNAGWSVRVLDHTDFSTVVAYVNEWSTLAIAPQLNDPGTGSIVLDADSPFWATTLPNGEPATVLRDREYLWEAWENGVLRMQWLGTTRRQVEVTDDETRPWSISGPGAAHVLTWAKVFPPGFPDPPAELTWPFTDTTPAMEIWLNLLQAAQGRGTVPWVQPIFTATRDAAGAIWADVATTYTTPGRLMPELGSDLLTQLDTATGQTLSKPAGMRAEWVMWPGFQLDVRPTIGVHRESTVIFYETQLRSVEKVGLSENVANVVVVRDSYGNITPATDATSIARWNRREWLHQQDNADEQAKRSAIAQIMLDQRSGERESWTIQVPYELPDRRPFVDYQLGDWIGVGLHDPVNGHVTNAYRVVAIAVQIDDTGTPTVELTLQSVLDSKQRELEKQLTAVVNTVTNVSNTIGTELPVGPDVPLVYQPGTGWIPVSDLDLGGGGGIGGGIQVFIQADDPGTDAHTGDFWYQP